jgi:hypothetical protein
MDVRSGWLSEFLRSVSYQRTATKDCEISTDRFVQSMSVLKLSHVGKGSVGIQPAARVADGIAGLAGRLLPFETESGQAP